MTAETEWMPTQPVCHTSARCSLCNRALDLPAGDAAQLGLLLIPVCEAGKTNAEEFGKPS